MGGRGEVKKGEKTWRKGEREKGEGRRGNEEESEDMVKGGVREGREGRGEM